MKQSRKKKEFAVIGLGRFGSSVAMELTQYGHYVLGIDINSQIVQNMADQLSQTACLDATQEDALMAVDIESFDAVIIGIGTDFENNLMITAALTNLGVQHIICKALTEKQQAILIKIGADKVIQPESQMGKRLAKELAFPWLNEQINLGPEHTISEIKSPLELIGKSLVEAEIRKKYGIYILIVKNHDIFLVSPPGEYIIQPDDTLVIVGSHKQIDHFMNKK
ncbi:MAG: TrkA family potassium uptake protein [Anaerolineaceae bacterium]|nr:TrkA family potassium uptake protein [Anaerolineaceae bacterium]